VPLPILQICCLALETAVETPAVHHWRSLSQSLSQFLPPQRFQLQNLSSFDSLGELFERQRDSPDCLLIFHESLNYILKQGLQQPLRILGIIMPVVIVTAANHKPVSPEQFPASHAVYLSINDLVDLPNRIEEAIAKFLQISPNTLCELPFTPADLTNSLAIALPSSLGISLALQQKRLAEKLQERLGYLGLYSKRDPKQFLRHLSESDRTAYLDQLKRTYRDIILAYFKDNTNPQDQGLNRQIDQLADLAFLGDVSASQILEIHMELMDEFAKQLKLEGRNVDILLDYRITLIDVIAHLCEMYRRSVSRP
jgi:circadian clock protein KaiA